MSNLVVIHAGVKGEPHASSFYTFPNSQTSIGMMLLRTTYYES